MVIPTAKYFSCRLLDQLMYNLDNFRRDMNNFGCGIANRLGVWLSYVLSSPVCHKVRTCGKYATGVNHTGHHIAAI
jgi:hypothetical protein